MRITALSLAGIACALSVAVLTAQSPLGRGRFGRPAVVASSNPIDAARRVDWSTAGVAGGIPTTRTQCGSTIAAYSGTAATINNAISACGANQVVVLGSGTFTLSTGIDFAGKSNVTLRGTGADATKIFGNGDSTCNGQGAAVVCLAATNITFYTDNGPTNAQNTVNWTAGFAQGTTQITLAAVTGTTNLAVGAWMMLDQVDDAADTNTWWVCAGPAYPEDGSACPPSDEGRGGYGRQDRAQVELVQVTAINGNVVTIDPPVRSPNWGSGHSPQAMWGSSTGTVTGMGLEDLSIDCTGSPGTFTCVKLFNCMGCWVSGIRSIWRTLNTTPQRSHMLIFQSAHSTIRNSYFYGTKDPDIGSTQYGLEFANAADMLVENNIVIHNSIPFQNNGSCTGCAWVYNYALDDYYTASPTWMQPCLYLHTAGNADMLFEGNSCSGFISDDVHGSHNRITLYRNRLTGWETGKSSQTTPVHLYEGSRVVNVIGNVLGTSTYHDTYEHKTTGCGNTNTTIFTICSATGLSASTLFRWGNYDTVTGTVKFDSAEVPTTGVFTQAIPSTHTLPASLIYSAKPSYFKALTYPSAGPDVSGGNESNVGGFAYKIPARVCYEILSDDGNYADSPAIKTFTPGLCY